MGRLCSFLLVTLFVHGAMSALKSQVLQFNDLEQLVSENNGNVKSSQSQVQAAQSTQNSFTRSFLPTLQVLGGSQKYKVGNSDNSMESFWRVEGRINLYRGGTDALEDKARQAILRGAQADLMKIKIDALTEARELYWEVASLKETIETVENGLENNMKNLASAKRRFAAGISAESDVLEFGLFRTSLAQQIKSMSLDLDVAKNRLAVLTGIEDHENIDVENLYHPSEESLKFDDLKPEQSAEMISLKEKGVAARLQAEKLGRWWTPSVDLYSAFGKFTGYERDARPDDNRNEMVAGIQVKIDLLSGLEKKREAQSSQYQAQALAYSAQQREREVTAVVHELQKDIMLQHSLLHDAEQAVKDSHRYSGIVLGEYKRGVKSSNDLLAATQRTMDINLNHIQILRTLHISRIRLLKIAGQ